MTDIFLSYSRDDLSTARRFAEAFEREGFSVWWDQTLNPGEAFDEVTEKALNEARAVVVLWSKKSVASRWVRAEATQANESKTLVPVMIEPCKRPIMFELTHTADLSNWKGNPDDPAWQAYLAGVKRIAGREVTGAPSLAAQLRAPRKTRIGAGALVGIFGLLVAIGVGLWAINRMPAEIAKRPNAVTAKSPAVVPAPERLGKPRIAILPFENLSPDPKNAFFTDGLHEEITLAMANRGRGSFEVISRTTMMMYRAAPKPMTEIARELGATHVLEGSVRRDGNDVRLTLQLIAASRDEHIWQRNFDRKVKNAMTLQSEVANEVAAQVSVKLAGGAQPTRAPTRSPEAYDLYLKALVDISSFTPGSTGEEVARVPRLLDQAIALDPDFGWAYALRAISRRSPDHGAQRAIILASARADFDTARRLIGADPRLFVFEAYLLVDENPDNPAPALAALDAAEAAGLTDDPQALLLRGTLAGPGQLDEGLRLLKRAIELDPANLNLLGNYQYILQAARKPREALQVRTTMAERWAGPFLPIGRAILLFDYTGRTEQLRATLGKYGSKIDPGVERGLELETLRLERRFNDLEKLAVASQATVIPVHPGGPGAGLLPVESVRGCAALLTGNRDLALKSGRALLGWTKANAVPDINPKLLRSLAAEAQLLQGDKAGAVATAQQVIQSGPSGSTRFQWDTRSWRGVLAVTLAWAGAENDAVDLLEQLAIQDFGFAPAEITRDPLFNVPLANNARYKALSARLEAQMAATNLE